jgi:hypothetical protein
MAAQSVVLRRQPMGGGRATDATLGVAPMTRLCERKRRRARDFEKGHKMLDTLPRQ